MKQILQSLKSGMTEVVEVPPPSLQRGYLLIETRKSLISPGTERMLVDFGKANLVKKARQQPDKVRMVLDKIKTDGIHPTVEAVFNKLSQPLPLGYCNVGRVIGVGDGCSTFSVGDRVISNGKHAEFVSVPVNLCAKIPDLVTDDEASFTVLGAIALQGIRLVNPTLGEVVVVTGLGLIGLLTVQLLRANGCRVIGIDPDKNKLKLAATYGAHCVDISSGQDPVEVAQQYTNRRGVDAVIITAATKSSQPVHQAALMCRQRGRIVLVGVSGLDLSRDDFFKKELTFQVSASYGPGRYDPNYEEKGQDYPIGFVRWTQQRNFEAILAIMADKQLLTNDLISNIYSIDEADKAYEFLSKSNESLGILLHYPGSKTSFENKTIKFISEPRAHEENSRASYNSIIPTRVSFIGAGNYTTGVLVPAFKKAGVILSSIASNSGVTGFYAGRKFGFMETTTDVQSLIEDPNTDAIVVTTRHNSHASYLLRAINACKHVFVEKPLCITLDELDEIQNEYNSKSMGVNLILMVGFNRRFAPQSIKIKELLENITGPKSFVMTINAGEIPDEHWTHDTELGGGRIIGEVCHFIDLLRFLASSSISGWNCIFMDTRNHDTVSITLKFHDGSIGSINYLANGNKSFPKERLEVFAEGKVLRLDNFQKLTGYGWSNFKQMNLWRQNKGQELCVKAFVDAIQGNVPAPIPIEEILEVSRLTIDIASSFSK